MPWELPCLFLPISTLYKTQHDWLTASQHSLRFQSLMNISTLPNALVNNREELWLADSDIPPLREKCSGQAGLPGSLPPCAETLAGEDAVREQIRKSNTGQNTGHMPPVITCWRHKCFHLGAIVTASVARCWRSDVMALSDYKTSAIRFDGETV